MCTKTVFVELSFSLENKPCDASLALLGNRAETGWGHTGKHPGGKPKRQWRHLIGQGLLERQPARPIDGKNSSRDLFSLMDKASMPGQLGLREAPTVPSGCLEIYYRCPGLFVVLRHRRSSDGKWVVLPWKKDRKRKKCYGAEPSVPKTLRNMSQPSVRKFCFILFWKEVVGPMLVRNDGQRQKTLGKL